MKTFALLAFSFLLGSSIFSQNDFTFEMYNSMDKKQNVLFSPISIKTAFAMVYEGANSETKKELETVFNFTPDNQEFINQLNDLKKVTRISNSLWILNDYKILDSYTQKIDSLFKSEPYSCDFKEDPQGSAKKINEWISKSTNGMIKKMVSAENVINFKMALVNAIYFKQNWKTSFRKNSTQKAQFFNLNGSETEIDLMQVKSGFKAAQTETEKVVVLPYIDEKTSMVIVLPEDMKTYNMNNEVYQSLTPKFRNQQVNLHLPKFTFETPTFELKPLLEDMGLELAFTDEADFSGMRAEKDLKVGTALHKAKIIVNEEGTEAAGATTVGMVKTKSVSMSTPPVMQMRVDKPFYYFITENATNTILFMGKMNSM